MIMLALVVGRSNGVAEICIMKGGIEETHGSRFSGSRFGFAVNKESI